MCCSAVRGGHPCLFVVPQAFVQFEVDATYFFVVQAGAANNPAVAEMMAGMDMSPENMKRQLGAMGMSPDQFIQKVGGVGNGMLENGNANTCCSMCVTTHAGQHNWLLPGSSICRCLLHPAAKAEHMSPCP